MASWYDDAVLEIEQFLLVAESVLGIDADRLARITKIPLAESALAAPFAGVADQQFYEHPVQQAAILASRIIRNHPLPDGNKRVAFILMYLYSKSTASSSSHHPTRSTVGAALRTTPLSLFVHLVSLESVDLDAHFREKQVASLATGSVAPPQPWAT